MEKKDVEKLGSLKICAILYPITTVLWLFTAGMNVLSFVRYGTELTMWFWTNIALAVVFGSLAVHYIVRYRKAKKKAESADVTVIG